MSTTRAGSRSSASPRCHCSGSSRDHSRPSCSRETKANQEAIGKMSDRVLASLSGARVVRSLASCQPRAVLRREQRGVPREEPVLARLRGSMGPVMGSVAAVGILVVFWYGRSLMEQGVITPGDFVPSDGLLRLSWPLLGWDSSPPSCARSRRLRAHPRHLRRQAGDSERRQTTGGPVRGDISVRDLNSRTATR